VRRPAQGRSRSSELSGAAVPRAAHAVRRNVRDTTLVPLGTYRGLRLE